MTDSALRKAAQRYVDAREALDMVNKRIHPQTWANLDEDADKALNDLRTALAEPEPAEPTQEQVRAEFEHKFGLTIRQTLRRLDGDYSDKAVQAFWNDYAAGRASMEKEPAK